MSANEIYTTLSFGIPIFSIFAIGSLAALLVQARQIAKQEQGGFANKALIGVSSFAVSVLVSILISFFIGMYVAALLVVLWFIILASIGTMGLGGDLWWLSMTLGTIPIVLITLLIGMVLGIWPLTVLAMRGYRVVKQKRTLGSKIGAAVIPVLGGICCVLSILTAAIVMTVIAIDLSGKNFGLT